MNVHTFNLIGTTFLSGYTLSSVMVMVRVGHPEIGGIQYPLFIFCFLTLSLVVQLLATRKGSRRENQYHH